MTGSSSSWAASPTPAVGFAMGVERVAELMTLAGSVQGAVCCRRVHRRGRHRGWHPRAGPRRAAAAKRCPGFTVQSNLGGGNFKAQFRRADRSGARLALVLGDDEIARGVVNVKPLRQEAGQSECPLPDLPSFVPEVARIARG